MAWVARDAGDPQVHVARVDRRGKLVHDVQITSVKGDAADVAIAWSGDKWIVAWVDTRDGNGEVYAATLDRDGRSVGRGQRITNAPGDASDVAILALPDAAGPDGRGAVWLAWANPRESPQDGFADIYVAPLRGRDASRAGDEVRDPRDRGPLALSRARRARARTSRWAGSKKRRWGRIRAERARTARCSRGSAPAGLPSRSPRASP